MLAGGRVSFQQLEARFAKCFPSALHPQPQPVLSLLKHGGSQREAGKSQTPSKANMRDARLDEGRIR